MQLFCPQNKYRFKSCIVRCKQNLHFQSPLKLVCVKRSYPKALVLSPWCSLDLCSYFFSLNLDSCIQNWESWVFNRFSGAGHVLNLSNVKFKKKKNSVSTLHLYQFSTVRHVDRCIIPSLSAWRGTNSNKSYLFTADTTLSCLWFRCKAGCFLLIDMFFFMPKLPKQRYMGQDWGFSACLQSKQYHCFIFFLICLTSYMALFERSENGWRAESQWCGSVVSSVVGAALAVACVETTLCKTSVTLNHCVNSF